MTTFQWKLVGITVLVLLALSAAGCGVTTIEFRQCMIQRVHGFVSVALAVGAFAMGCWLGIETATATRRNWLGWVVGPAVFFALLLLMMWLGFEPPASSYDD